MNEFRPRKRVRNVKVEEFQGEVLVYDLDNHRAHCLNGVAAKVWNLCDGTQSVAQIAAAISDDPTAAPDEALVWTALTELDTASLLDTPIDTATHEHSRRSAIAKFGWAAAIPLMLSIAVPEPAYAQSAVVTH
jgi:hypothetical protein